MLQQLVTRLQSLRTRFEKKPETFLECENALNALSEEKIKVENRGNEAMVRLVLSKETEYVTAIDDLTRKWVEIEHLSSSDTAELMFITAKVQGVTELLSRAANHPENDLFSVPPDSPRWVSLSSRVQIVSPEHIDEVQQGIHKIGNQLIYGNAVVSKGFECADKRTKEVVIGAGIVVYGINKKKMRAQALRNYAKPEKDSILALWNMVDSVIMAPLTMRGLVDIPLSRLIYLPRTTPPIFPYSKSFIPVTNPSYSEEFTQ